MPSGPPARADFAAIQFKARATRDAGLVDLCERIRAANASVVVCPEMALVGYDWPDVASVLPVAEGVDGTTVRTLAGVAAECRSWVVAGFPERDRDRVFNSAVILDPRGAVRFVYRKTLLFEADVPWATPGDSGYRAFDTDVGRLGVGICMDLNDDRFLDWAAPLDAVALPTNWIQDEGSVWDYWRWRLYTGWPEEFPDRIDGRARVDGLLVAANSYGREGAYTLSGRSALLTWHGVVASASETGDAVLTARSTR